MYASLAVERDGRIATVWMDRPAVFNAFDEQLIADLDAAFSALDTDPSVRVVVLAGRGPHFSAGADLHWMRRAAGYTHDENLADARRFAAMLRRLAEMGKPTVARVQGAALGGGTGLAAACDIAIASDDALFATSEARFGIIPAVISPFVLRAIGPRHALRYFQSAERFTARRAQEIGLVSEVVPRSALDDAVGAVTTALAASGPRAQQAAKQLIGAVHGRPIDAALSEETAQRIARQRATDEARDGIHAFLEKRPPGWST